MKINIHKVTNAIKQGYLIPFAIICFALFTNDICLEDPNSSTSTSAFDNDGDGITDDTEKNQTNIDLYPNNMDWEVYTTDPSIAVGQYNNGSLSFGLNLKDKGYNYYHHYGSDATDTDDWGTGKLIFVLTKAAHKLLTQGNDEYYSGTTTYDPTFSDFTGPLQIGDMSNQYGGTFSPHGSHQNGIDADLRYVRVDRQREPLDIATDPVTYDEAATHNLFYAFRDVYQDIQVIYAESDYLGFDVLYNNVSIINDEPDHSDHFHVRINCPTGQCQ